MLVIGAPLYLVIVLLSLAFATIISHLDKLIGKKLSDSLTLWALLVSLTLSYGVLVDFNYRLIALKYFLWVLLIMALNFRVWQYY